MGFPLLVVSNSMSSDIFRPVNLENYVRTNFTSIRTSKNEDLTDTTTYFVFCLIREKLALLASSIAGHFSYPSFTLPSFCREGSNFYPSSFSFLLRLYFAVSFTFLQKGKILAQISTILL